MINEKIFKAYDVRGVYPTEIDEAAAYAIGQAYVDLVKPKKMVVGRDMRVASPALLDNFVRGAREAGVDVVSIGEMSVDAFYYAVWRDQEFDGGVYCTASHNPKEYHGFKMFRRDGSAVRGTDIKAFALSRQKLTAQRAGTFSEMDVMGGFIDYLMSFVDVKKIKPLKVVVDAGNGMAGKIIPELSKRLPVSIIPLFFELDGNFPNHPSNPLEAVSQKVICETVVKNKADLGVIFDGDTDRLFFVTEHGQFVRADITLLILARYLMDRHPGAGVVYNVLCSKAVPELVAKWGGRAYRSKVGYVNVKELMIKHAALVGGEVSAHYSFKDNFCADSGFIAFLMALEFLSRSPLGLAEVVKQYELYPKTEEIVMRLDDIPGKVEAVKTKYADGKLDDLDGVTVEYPDYWFNVRASNTEPILKFVVEANTQKLLDQKAQELEAFLKSL